MVENMDEATFRVLCPVMLPMGQEICSQAGKGAARFCKDVLEGLHKRARLSRQGVKSLERRRMRLILQRGSKSCAE